ncbi:hypothetical protein XarjCFBP7645_11640 [Xanthomonas arboricola]|uniref:Uncharacterized protein n=1 Tax=Xanthomonas arboricola TaxID=56448 RepID=A0A2S7AEK6_9XANT|nr:hypothetical protein XarjCFBP7645_11640 [Xanthomonas arboricola]
MRANHPSRLANDRFSAGNLQNLRRTSARLATSSFHQTADQLPGAVSSPIAGPLAAWMPPRGLRRRIHGVSCKR